jgi:hypothetical protein
VDPRIFKLTPYKLEAGNSYQIYVTVTTALGSTASTNMQVFVNHNVLKSVISGGSTVSVPENLPFTLDGSKSSDTDYQTSAESQLFYHWGCSFVAGATYGSSCNHILPDDTSVSILIIEAFKMWSNSSYQFTLTVSSADGRADSASCVVEPAPAGAPVVLITSSVAQINADQVLILDGIITASSNIVSWWEVSQSSIDLSISSLTKFSTTFAASIALNGVVFPLAVSRNTFAAGLTYTLRLVSYPQGRQDLLSYGETSVVINAPPFSGVFSVNPFNGSALITPFNFIASDWIDDLSSYPFTYSFSYLLSPDQQQMKIVSANPKSYTTTTLPSGLLVQQNVVLCYVSVADIFGAATIGSSGVIVTMDSSLDATSVAVSALSRMNSALELGGIVLS